MSNINLLDNVKNLEEALKCGVCKNLLNDPLLVAKCGHSTCRDCFMQGFNSQCPVCHVPVNTKDSLEDKLLKELLIQLEKLKGLLNNDATNKNSVTAPESVISDCASKSSESKLVKSIESEKKDIEAEQNEVTDECVNDAKPHFSCSTPIVKRKKKVLPRMKHRLSSEDENVIQSTPASVTKSKVLSSSNQKKSLSSSRSEENKSKNSPSPSVSLNKKNQKGETHLHRAVIKGDLAKVKELIEQGANVNTQDNNGWTPLHEASNHGFLEIAKLLVDNGSLVNVPSQNDNITPLHDALINNHIPIAILLASRGADLHAKTALGYTALDLCKNEEDKASLVASCSPFICANISMTNKKKGAHGDSDKVVLLPTGLSDKQRVNLEKCAPVLKAEIVDTFTPEVTHIITSCNKDGNCTRTMKVLLGILTGKWIINYQWIDVCLEYKIKVDEEVFEVQGTKNQPNTQGPKNARQNMEEKYPPLFDGFYFYLHGPFSKPIPEREEICNLIHIGGGKVLSREPREETVAIDNYKLPFHAPDTPLEGVNHIILYQDKPPRDHHFRSGHICTVHIMWLIESITEFKLKELKN